MNLEIRTMTRVELDLALDWAAAEGWNPGHDDADAFHAADPDGFLIGCVGGEPVACTSVVAHDDRFGFLGLYICRPQHRGKGYGLALWRAGLDRLGNRVVGLDGVVAQQTHYAKSGFALAHRNIRFAGPASAAETADPRIVEFGADRPIGLAGSILAYDRPLFPGSRARFLRAWLTPPGRRTLALVEDDAIRGYGCVRRCRAGYKVGPLFADDGAVAGQLFASLTARLRGEPVYLDVPEPNAEAVRLAERHGMKPVFETARMYRGDAPRVPLDRVFGITTFELG